MTTNTIAVTGSEGFIASHLVEALVQRGHRVRAMVQYNSFSSAGWLDKMSADVLDNVAGAHVEQSNRAARYVDLTILSADGRVRH